MPDPRNDDGFPDLFSTQDIIEEARRPVLVARHRPVIEEMESNVAESFVDGSSQHPRLKQMLAELELPSEQERIRATVEILATDEHYQGLKLREALIEELALLRERSGIEIATLQLHVMGVYRHLRHSIHAHQRLWSTLDDLRNLTADRLALLLSPLPIHFASPDLFDSLVLSSRQQVEAVERFKALSRPQAVDATWADAGGEPAISREDEEPLLDLPPAEREVARQRLIDDRIRSRFYRAVFVHWFDRDSLATAEIEHHGTILDWLIALNETPHLYPFLQGQTPSQKRFRISQLSNKLVQVHEIYQRLNRAAAHPSYRARFTGQPARHCLAILAKDRYPALKVDRSFIAATLYCPFPIFVAWLQDLLAHRDFILPPDSRR